MICKRIDINIKAMIIFSERFLDEYEKKTFGAKKTIILVDFLQGLLNETVHAFLHINQ